MAIPPEIVEIMPPPEMERDFDMEWTIAEDKMTRDYVSVLFLCSILLIIVVIL